MTDTRGYPTETQGRGFMEEHCGGSGGGCEIGSALCISLAVLPSIPTGKGCRSVFIAKHGRK